MYVGTWYFSVVGNFAVDVFGFVSVHVGSDGERAKQRTFNCQLIFAWWEVKKTQERRGEEEKGIWTIATSTVAWTCDKVWLACTNDIVRQQDQIVIMHGFTRPARQAFSALD